MDKRCLVKQHILVIVDAVTKFMKLYTIKTMA